MATHRIEDALQRLRSEYQDMPRLSLTPGEVARIVNVDPPTARVLLEALADSHFLKPTRCDRRAVTNRTPCGCATIASTS